MTLLLKFRISDDVQEFDFEMFCTGAADKLGIGVRCVAVEAPGGPAQPVLCVLEIECAPDSTLEPPTHRSAIIASLCCAHSIVVHSGVNAETDCCMCCSQR